MNFQDIIRKLNEYWAKQGCIIQQPYDIEVGAGTFNPATFLRVLGPEPWRVGYVEPSRRPTDGRYGNNPWRMGHYYQYQVILKPVPANIQEIYLQSLESLGIDLMKHDVRFVEDDWESPTLGASGLGWEVWLDSSEITQYTYFQQMGSIELNPISVEITYGLERIAVNSQDVDSIFNIEWVNGITYGHVHHQGEIEFSRYYLDEANIAMLFNLFDVYEKEAYACLDKNLILPGTDYVLKCSHAFNILDARGSISVTERASYISRVRYMARKCAQAYIKQREEMGHPLLYCFNVQNSKSLLQRPAELFTEKVDSKEPEPSGSDLLLEIGTEEIPASYIEPALTQMEDFIKKLFTDNSIDFKEVHVLGTPRRLILSATGVSAHQPDKTVEVTGPSKKAAFDESGNPTKAAEGFTRKYGASTDDLRLRSTDKGDYVYLIIQEKGKTTSEMLSEYIPKMIASLAFPKTMYFNISEESDSIRMTFARPIRWIVALFGNNIIKFSLGNIESDRYTFGHRFCSDSPMWIQSASLDGFKEILRESGVIADHRERKELIRNQITNIMESEGSQLYIDDDLLETVTFLVEMPRPVTGVFNSSYLSLPVEVLETAMKKHQKYFSLHAPATGFSTIKQNIVLFSRKLEQKTKGIDLNSNVSLLPKFITITNGTGDDEVIRHGNERVLGSRLADAEFFYKEDQKSSLADKALRLEHVVFQEELGSLYDKSRRLKELASFICQIIGVSEEVRANAIRAAELCKVDLITQMVVEFPSLQGIMGYYYALNSGENIEAALAIRYHYNPNSPTGSLPENLAGCIVSIADKLDTIIGYFGIGNIPSGSQDPYALRRQATGIVRILVEKEINISLEQIIQKSISLYGNLSNFKVNASELSNSAIDFLKARISSLLSDRGFAYDVIDSVLSVDLINPLSFIKQSIALSKFKNQESFDRIYPAFNRVIRIIPKEYIAGTIDEMLFQDSSEQKLYQSILKIEPDIKRSAEKGNYDEILQLLETLCDDINAFFDNVMVMDSQVKLRDNRLALLYRLAKMLFLVADFSKLVV